MYVHTYVYTYVVNDLHLMCCYLATAQAVSSSYVCVFYNVKYYIIQALLFLYCSG